jgi:hypothetical protein
MAKYTTTFDADAALVQLHICHRPRGADWYNASTQIGGDLGGGTVTMFVSLDNGTTKNPLKDLTGTAYSTNTVDTFNFRLAATSENSNQIIIYATLAGAVAPDMSIVTIDNT